MEVVKTDGDKQPEVPPEERLLVLLGTMPGVASELMEQFDAAAVAAQDTGGKGWVSLTVNCLPPKGDGTHRYIVLSPEVKSKVPRRGHPTSVAFVGADGHVQHQPDRQGELDLGFND